MRQLLLNTTSKDPQIAWRSVLLLTQKLTDPASGKIDRRFSNSFFEPYGIKDGEAFLGSVSPDIVTVKYDDEDDVAVIAKTTDQGPKERRSLPKLLKTPGSLFRLMSRVSKMSPLIGNAADQSQNAPRHIRRKNLSSQATIK